MTERLSHCFLWVFDQEEALTFYTKTVGLEVRTDATMGDYRWLTVGPAAQPEIEIGLSAIGPPLAPADHDAVRELVAKGVGALIFSTDDCRATFDRLDAAGAEVMQEVVEQPYGVIDCAFRDPFGNMIRFSQELAR